MPDAEPQAILTADHRGGDLPHAGRRARRRGRGTRRCSPTSAACGGRSASASRRARSPASPVSAPRSGTGSSARRGRPDSPVPGLDGARHTGARHARRPVLPPAGAPARPVLRARPAPGRAASSRARVVDEVHGFRSFDERDLLGFVDGTENPEGAAAQRAVTVGGEDPASPAASYLVVQKYVHDLRAWNALTVEQQELAIGRRKANDVELPDELKPADSHVALNTIVDADGEEQQIVRYNMPFGRVGAGEFGTYFAGYARSPDVIDLMLEHMFIGDPPGRPTASSTSRRRSPATCSSSRRPASSTTGRRPPPRRPGSRPGATRGTGRSPSAASGEPPPGPHVAAPAGARRERTPPSAPASRPGPRSASPSASPCCAHVAAAAGSSSRAATSTTTTSASPCSGSSAPPRCAATPRRCSTTGWPSPTARGWRLRAREVASTSVAQPG